MSNIKLKDVAMEMGISVVTVSNALSGKKGVSDTLRKEIMDTAKRMGYDVSRYSRKRGEEIRICVVVSKKYIEVGESFYWSMYQQVAYEASKKSCFTILALLEKDGNQPLPPILHDSSMDGFLVIGKLERRQLDTLFQVVTAPVVLLDFYETGLPCDAVLSSNYIGMYRASRYLLERGHEKIGFVGSLKATNNILERFLGFRKAMEEYRKPIRKEWILEDRDLASGYIQITLPERLPTAFVCNCDFVAGFMYDLLKAKGYRVPQDISLISYDNYSEHPYADHLTTYNVDMPKMARTAIELLLKKKKNPQKKQEIRYIDSHIEERESVKPLRKVTL